MPRDRRRVASLLFRDCTAIVLRMHGGDGGATAVPVRSYGGHGGVAAVSRRCCGGNGGVPDTGPTRGSTAEVLYMFKVSAVPPRRSAILTVFPGATAINDGTTAEPLRPWRCNYGLCRISTAVAMRLRCDGGRMSAVMTILRDATAINEGTTAIMAVSLRNHGDNGGATAVYAVQAPQWYRASGVTGV